MVAGHLFSLKSILVMSCFFFRPRVHIPDESNDSMDTGQLFSNNLPRGNFSCFFAHLIFFIYNFFEKLFQEFHLSVKQFGFRLGPTYCRA